MDVLTFPKDFTWGTATSAYQIEGYPLADGAAPSIWHTFSHARNKIHNNENGDIACDHYHRFQSDVELISELGTNAYRFSVAWPRIVPEPDRINEKGLDFYNHLVDSLLDKNITPFITLFHWETPQWLEDRGGFTSPESVGHFLHYAQILINKLGDRVKHWITINEPMVYTLTGYGTGEMAPGRKFDLKGLFHAVHRLLVIHGEVVRLCKSLVTDASIGIAEAQIWIRPANPGKEKDILAAEFMDSLINGMYIDPIMHGTYPENILSRVHRYLPDTFERDLEHMKAPHDFIGINYYMKKDYRHSWLTPVVHAKEVKDPKAKRSEMWEIYPDGLYNLLIRLKERYGNPVCYITENGFPTIQGDGGLTEDPLKDDSRIVYLKDHIRMAYKALENGVRLKGYFHWSLMDNFEWHHGYNMRFGLFHTDFNTMERKWKKSARWYQKLVTSNSLS